MRPWLCALTIVAGACGRIGFDAGGAPGDGPGGDGAGGDSGTPGTCNLISRVADTFDDASATTERLASRELDAGTSFAVTGGELVMTPATNAAGYTEIALRTLRFYDMRGGRFSAEVTQVASHTAVTGVGVDYRSQNTVYVAYEGGMLHARRIVEGAFTNLADAAYSAEQDRFWAVRETAGRVFFETSRDGVAWSSFFDVADPWDMSLVRGSLTVTTAGPEPEPGTASFGSINGGVASSSPACAARTFVDRFDGAVDPHLWQNGYMSAGASYVEGGGTLVISETDSTGAYAGLRSAAGFSLAGDEIHVRIASPPQVASNLEATFSAFSDSNNAVALIVGSGHLLARSVIAGTPTSVMTSWNPADTHLRIRESGGQLLWDVSTDGLTWVNARTIPTPGPPFEIDDMIVDVEAGNGTAPDSTSFADFNIP